MKHDLIITLILVFLFIASHIIGLFIIKNYLPQEKSLPLGIEKPQFNEKTSYIPIAISLLLATLLALLLIRLSALRLWKLWFFLSIFLTLTVAFTAFIQEIVAVTLALIFSILKIFKSNVFIHNFTELFVYGGLAAIFVPVLSLWSITILLLIISVYDMIAVWKTKHMISMAKFQAKSKIFAGLFVPYTPKSEISEKITAKVKTTKKVYREAILGGGDIAFPLLFSGVILKTYGFLPALILSLSAAIALMILFLIAEKKKFYPAMPFLSIGCFAGYFLIKLLF